MGHSVPSGSGSGIHSPTYVGAQKLVPDLDTALRRVHEHCLPLETARTLRAYGRPSAVNRLLVLNGEHVAGRGTVLLLREAIGS
ncbi:hypothetical protein ACWC6I_26460 [Streptomyces sp. NPDC001414]